MSKYITRRVRNNRKDPQTGEILEYTERQEVIKSEVEPFFLTYSREILALYGKSIFNATTKVLWKLLEIAEYNTGKVYVTTERRNAIMSACDISRASYDRAVRELVEADIMSKEGNTYTIRENMFWKGDREERRKLMSARLRVTFSPVFEEDNEQTSRT